MGVATRITDTVVVLRVDDLGWLTVSCATYDIYKALPQAVKYQDNTYGLKGWNSDKGHAYYEPSTNIAYAIKS